MGRYVEVESGIRLWVQEDGAEHAPVLLLVMGANSSGLAWPGRFVAELARHHRVVRYDHRDTGRSTASFDRAPYGLVDLARDAVAVLDAVEAPRAHVVGMSMGGMLTQLLLLDHPERLLSAALFCAQALPAPPASEHPLAAARATLPGPDERLRRLWERMAASHGGEAETALRVEQWRLYNGGVLPFEEEKFRRMEERLARGRARDRGQGGSGGPHTRASQTGLARADELARVRTPSLVVEAPQDLVVPPAHARWLAGTLPGARLVHVPGMGHLLHPAVTARLAAEILAHTAAASTDSPGASYRGTRARYLAAPPRDV
ncbi:alpha/beta fold hydrolase [Streptomyces sp. NPDC087300]|uniref:alpha/beta fold hydrolase n=1 Tax=Streptomyces sp. NPDC087300 TaxID=3365780 RepID=UPI0038278D51